MLLGCGNQKATTNHTIQRDILAPLTALQNRCRNTMVLHIIFPNRPSSHANIGSVELTIGAFYQVPKTALPSLESNPVFLH